MFIWCDFQIEVFIYRLQYISIYCYEKHKMFAQNICSLKFHLSCHHPNINHRKGTPNGFHKRNWFESWMKCEEFAIGFLCIPIENDIMIDDLLFIFYHSIFSRIEHCLIVNIIIQNSCELFIIEVSTVQMIYNDYLKWHLCSGTRKKTDHLRMIGFLLH